MSGSEFSGEEQVEAAADAAAETTPTDSTESPAPPRQGSSHTTIESTVSRLTLSFIEKRNMHRVIVGGTDVTPDNLLDPDYVVMDERAIHAAFDSNRRPDNRQRSEAVLLRSSKSGMKVYATTIDLDDIHIDHSLNTAESVYLDDVDLERAPSAYGLPKMLPLTAYPSTVTIELKETETIFLFDLPTYSVDKSAPEAAAVEFDNDFYAYITVGKGRNRKMIQTETQTESCITQSRHTLAVRPQKKNASAFASVWDMEDTYAKLQREKTHEEDDEMVLYQSAAPHYLRKRNKVVSVLGSQEQVKNLVNTPQFQDAVMITERVLASKEYVAEQKRFRGLVHRNPLSLDLIYIYSMKPLWTLECPEPFRPVSAVCFNPKNNNIMAVGHGRFGFAENQTGLVCIWCTKNPCKPERIYRFAEPVTSLAFSEKLPNRLACGFFNGDVIILDITYYEIKLIAKSKRDTNPCFEPVWSMNWHMNETRDIEYVMTSCQDGRINRFTSTKTHDFICAPMMRVTSVEGKTKGLEIVKASVVMDVPITRYPAALCVKWHPKVHHIYFVGTDEGCIHKCSTHYLNQHMDVFRAHAGPVYALEFSPFMDTLLVSCGADGALRLWLEGIDDVIVTLQSNAAVYDLAFCPVNSTVLVSVSGPTLSVWDWRRKTHVPCMEHIFPGHINLVYCAFSASGDNVFVGDTAGRIHTYHLEDMPIAPFYQRRVLDETIKKALCTRPQLLKQLDKLEKFKQSR